MVRDRLFIFYMHNPYDKPLPLTCGIRGHSCFTNTSCPHMHDEEKKILSRESRLNICNLVPKQ